MALEQSAQALSKAQREELEGIVAPSTQIARGILFCTALGFIGLLAKAIQNAFLASPPLWPIPTIVAALWLYRRAKNWTGGPELRRAAAKDLAGGVVQITIIEAASVAMIEEVEDEGPTYFVTARSGELIMFSGQEIARYQRKSFPWSTIGVLETPHAKQCFALKRMGEPHTIDAVMAPLSYESAKALGCFNENFVVLNEQQRAIVRALENSPLKGSANSSPTNS